MPRYTIVDYLFLYEKAIRERCTEPILTNPTPRPPPAPLLPPRNSRGGWRWEKLKEKERDGAIGMLAKGGNEDTDFKRGIPTFYFLSFLFHFFSFLPFCFLLSFFSLLVHFLILKGGWQDQRVTRILILRSTSTLFCHKTAWVIREIISHSLSQVFLFSFLFFSRWCTISKIFKISFQFIYFLYIYKINLKKMSFIYVNIQN